MCSSSLTKLNLLFIPAPAACKEKKSKNKEGNNLLRWTRQQTKQEAKIFDWELMKESN